MYHSFCDDFQSTNSLLTLLFPVNTLNDFALFRSEDDDDIPTVVADRWELPHCCLKMGRVLGSGAFGQVVKGRVSKTLLQHRGVDSHMFSQRKGTHLTVAIKMLQGT